MSKEVNGGNAPDAPVEDHTNLNGNFDFQIDWSPGETPDSATPSLLTDLQQLGLKFRSAKGTVETMVIEQIAHPSLNQRIAASSPAAFRKDRSSRMTNATPFIAVPPVAEELDRVEKSVTLRNYV